MGRRAHSLWNVILPKQNTISLSRIVPLSHKTTTSWLDQPWRFCLCKRAAAIEIRVLCLFCVLHLLVQAWPAMLPGLPACCPPRPSSSDPANYVNRSYSVRATITVEIDSMNKTPTPISWILAVLCSHLSATSSNPPEMFLIGDPMRRQRLPQGATGGHRPPQGGTGCRAFWLQNLSKPWKTMKSNWNPQKLM